MKEQEELRSTCTFTPEINRPETDRNVPQAMRTPRRAARAHPLPSGRRAPEGGALWHTYAQLESATVGPTTHAGGAAVSRAGEAAAGAARGRRGRERAEGVHVPAACQPDRAAHGERAAVHGRVRMGASCTLQGCEYLRAEPQRHGWRRQSWWRGHAVGVRRRCEARSAPDHITLLPRENERRRSAHLGAAAQWCACSREGLNTSARRVDFQSFLQRQVAVCHGSAVRPRPFRRRAPTAPHVWCSPASRCARRQALSATAGVRAVLSGLVAENGRVMVGGRLRWR